MSNRLQEVCPMRHENGNCKAVGGFCTSNRDEICKALREAYYIGQYHLLSEIKDKLANPTNNYEYIRSLSIEGMADLLYRLSNANKAPSEEMVREFLESPSSYYKRGED